MKNNFWFLTKKFYFYGLKIFFILICLTPIFAAKAEFRVCNMTSSAVSVAIGYKDLDDWHSEGWWLVQASQCETILEGALKSRYYYLHAEDSRNEDQWRGAISMCVKDEKFFIKSPQNCYVRGYQKAGFQEIDTGTQTRWTVQLMDNQAISKDKVNILSNEVN